MLKGVQISVDSRRIVDVVEYTGTIPEACSTERTLAIGYECERNWLTESTASAR